ncbi:PA3496 family putative envelope integrity protein [Pseudomonas nicosulfuronedens]
MANDKEDLELEDDVSTDDSDDGAETSAEVAKTNLTKRRIIDNYLEERRLQRQLSDYDFDL